MNFSWNLVPGEKCFSLQMLCFFLLDNLELFNSRTFSFALTNKKLKANLCFIISVPLKTIEMSYMDSEVQYLNPAFLKQL